MAYRNIAAGMLAAVSLLAFVSGCGQETVPADLTQAALHQLRSGKYDEAITTATEAMHANPQAAAPYLYRGRAYHFRNGMGDRQRAIADFGEAIRLAPESSDAYYSRALVYRDIGQTELAATDDTAARKLDGLIEETYSQLPDLTPSNAIAKASDEDPLGKNTGGTQGKSEQEQKQLYKDLKSRFDPGFGELRTTPKQSPTADNAGGTGEESLTTQYRNLLEGTPAAGESTPSGTTGDGGTASPGQFGQFGQPVPTLPATTPGGAVTPGPPLAPNAATESLRPGGNWQGPTLPPLTSPFAQRPAVPVPGELPPGIQSPFPKRATGSTGYVQPVNPFGAGAGQAPATRPFSTPPPSSRFSNPIVRPDYPRDYLP